MRPGRKWSPRRRTCASWTCSEPRQARLALPACSQCPAITTTARVAQALLHTRYRAGAVCCWLVLLYSFRHTMYGRFLLILTIMLLVSVCPSAHHASVAATQVRYRAARQYAHAARQAAGRPDGAAFQDRAYQVALWC